VKTAAPPAHKIFFKSEILKGEELYTYAIDAANAGIGNIN
jgi:hypothetical protein